MPPSTRLLLRPQEERSLPRSVITLRDHESLSVSVTTAITHSWEFGEEAREILGTEWAQNGHRTVRGVGRLKARSHKSLKGLRKRWRARRDSNPRPMASEAGRIMFHRRTCLIPAVPRAIFLRLAAAKRCHRAGLDDYQFPQPSPSTGPTKQVQFGDSTAAAKGSKPGLTAGPRLLPGGKIAHVVLIRSRHPGPVAMTRTRAQVRLGASLVTRLHQLADGEQGQRAL